LVAALLEPSLSLRVLPKLRRERLDVRKNLRHILLQFLQQLARVAVLNRLAALGPIARGGEVPILALNGGCIGEPSIFRPGFCRVARLPGDPHFSAIVVSGNQARQIIGLDRLIVIGIKLETVIACVQEHHPLRAPALDEDQHRSFYARIGLEHAAGEREHRFPRLFCMSMRRSSLWAPVEPNSTPSGTITSSDRPS
jgi:hypothetical protein